MLYIKNEIIKGGFKNDWLKQKLRLLFIVGFHYFIMEEPSRHVKAMYNVRVPPPPPPHPTYNKQIKNIIKKKKNRKEKYTESIHRTHKK
jgi:hypothetical protein